MSDRHWIASGLVVLAIVSLSASAEKPKPSGPYESIAEAYLKGDFKSTEKLLADATPKELASLTPLQQADIAYVKQALAECHPAWWEPCKTGEKVPFAPTIWGQTLNAIYDANGKKQFNIEFGAGGKKVVTVTWSQKEMDNPAHAEHGFSHGDLANLGTWQTLGSLAVLVNLQPKALNNITVRDQARLQRYIDFRGNITCAYYGSPMSRRWMFWLDLAGFLDKYAALPNIEVRKAVGSWFLVEVLTNPHKYPSLKLPAPAPEAAEKPLADHYRVRIEKKSWTIAEDKALREALKLFAAANNLNLFESQKVALPNQLFHALDTDEDKPHATKRDDWIKVKLRILAKQPAP